MFQRLLTFIRDWIEKMITPNSISKAVGASEIVTNTVMMTEIQYWKNLYTNNAPWITNKTKSLNLPATISNIIARDTTIEMKVSVSGSKRADFIMEQLSPLLDKISQHLEVGCSGGGLMFKPYLSNNGVIIDVSQADMFYPVSFDSNGKIPGCVFVDQKKIGRYYYTRLEFHSFVPEGLWIQNKAFRSNETYEQTGDLGQQVPLSSVADWAEIRANDGSDGPIEYIANIKKPLYGYFRYPRANNIDSTSPLGVACFSPSQRSNSSVNLIKDADDIYSSLVWEFMSGERAIYAEEGAFEKGADGKPKLPDERLYRTLKSTANVGDKGNLFNAWSPEFRDASIKSGLDAVLKKIEFVNGLSYGIISDPQAVALTATEIKMQKQAYYATITNTQKALRVAIDDLIYAIDVWATLGNLAPAGTYTVTYDFDDSIIADHDTQFMQDSQAVTIQAMPKYEFVKRNYGLSEEDAKRWVAEASQESSNSGLSLFNPPQGF